MKKIMILSVTLVSLGLIYLILENISIESLFISLGIITIIVGGGLLITYEDEKIEENKE